MNVDVAKNLADRRRAAGLSQEQLAEKLGVTRQAVSKWERSESSPDTDNLIALAQLYGVSLDDLLYARVGVGGSAEGANASAEDGSANAEGASAESARARAEGASAKSAAAAGAEAATATDADSAAGTSAAAASATAADTEGASGSESQPQSGHLHDSENVHVGFDGIHVEDGRDYVHVSWREGVHVVDGKKGDTVHVGWDGVHVNDKSYDYRNPHWREEANRDLGVGEGRAFDGQRAFLRAWNRFPFPLLVIIAYILIGVFLGHWGEGLFLAFAIPLYYLVGQLIATRRVARFVMAVYPIAVVAWFFYMAFVLNSPHPAWVMFLTIPLVEWLVASLSHQHRRKKRHHAREENVFAVTPVDARDERL
ncbi:MAG: helix-turn-helix domain-containing protein [Eggerthellaceae bacterium]|nr:helix-turn-helix domain-containing protein [Eggerthellaceae bacterium]